MTTLSSSPAQPTLRCPLSKLHRAGRAYADVRSIMLLLVANFQANPTTCTYDANLTEAAFYALWDVAYKTMKAVLPHSRLIGPSIADGGPGNFGFQKTVFPFLQRFLKHAHVAGTLPDVLTWHVTMIRSNGTLLVDHHAALAAWAANTSIPLPPIGHNEILGPPETLDPVSDDRMCTLLQNAPEMCSRGH